MRDLIVSSDDVDLYVKVDGESLNPTVLLLHGFPDNHASWHHQVETLKQTFQVITFDMRGVGNSTPSAKQNAYHMDHMLADIDAVLNATVGAEGRVHLVGHDWGSVIGWSFVSTPRYAHRVISYTSMSGPHLRLMLDWARRNLISGNPKRIAQALQQGVFSWYVYLFNVPLLPELLFKQFGRSIWRALLKANGVDGEDSYLNTTQLGVEKTCLNPIELYRQNPLNPPPLPAKKSIIVPVQLIIPRGDRFISHQLFEFYDEYIKTLEQHVIEGKHWAHHSHHQCFNQYLMQFIDRIERSA